MFTLLTGSPGAGKTLYAVWEMARKVPGTTIEVDGAAVPRRLLSNIKELRLDHELIGRDQLETWHEWAKPGDVIIYDEVQEVFRPRALGVKVPECIAKVETHRHLGVDLIFITQDPRLMDANLRRLVNQHFHLRRMSKRTAMVYEYDHCGTPGNYRTAMQSKFWMHPAKGYEMYKSAQAHTKPTARFPRIAVVLVLAIAAFAYIGPTAYARLSASVQGKSLPGAAQAPAAPVKVIPPPSYDRPKQAAQVEHDDEGDGRAGSQPAGPVRGVLSGCITVRTVCRCFDGLGQPVDAPQACAAPADLPQLSAGVVTAGGRPGWSDAAVDGAALAAMGNRKPLRTLVGD